VELVQIEDQVLEIIAWICPQQDHVMAFGHQAKQEELTEEVAAE
jgi:hypothetical protein